MSLALCLLGPTHPVAQVLSGFCKGGGVQEQWRRAIEALEARAPPDGVATLVNSLQNRVKSITVRNFERKNGK